MAYLVNPAPCLGANETVSTLTATPPLSGRLIGGAR
jgi:hypothetical protein